MRTITYHHVPGALPDSLQNVPFFLGLEDALIDKLLEESVLLECDPGDTIITEGERSRFFCILLKGTIDIVKQGKKVGRVANSGEIIGELGLASDTARTASAVASTPVFCLKVDPGFLVSFDDVERSGFYAALYKFVTKILGERLEESSRRIAQLEERVRQFEGGGDVDAATAMGVYRL